MRTWPKKWSFLDPFSALRQGCAGLANTMHSLIFSFETPHLPHFTFEHLKCNIYYKTNQNKDCPPPRKKCGHFSSLSFCNRNITKSCVSRAHSWFFGLCHCSTSSAMYARFTAGLLNLLLIKCKTLITYISTFPSCLRITFLHSFKTFITHVYSERLGIQTS